MSHNLIYNIIPGVISLAVILGGIFWCIVADIRRQNGKAALVRLHVRHPERTRRTSVTWTARVGFDA